MDKFSENNNDNFQVINMNYKLKKIKNRKKNNYKNIQPLEILDNINTKNNSIIDSKINIKGVNEIEPFVSGTSDNNIIEGLGFPDSHYDGIDNVNENRNNSNNNNPIQSLVDIIERIYNYINKFNQIMSTKLAMILSDKKASESDIFLVRQYFAWTESILAAGYVTYNIFFIMYYKDNAGIKLIEISRDKIKENAEQTPLLYLFLYFFEYAFIFPEMFNKLIADIIPSFTKKIINPTWSFSMIFIILTYFFKNFAIFFKNFLIGVLVGDGSYAYYFYIGLIVLGIYYLADFIKKGSDIISNSIILDKIGFILFLINGFIRGLIAVYFIGVPLGIFFTIAYILIYTFIAIIFYMGFDLNIFNKIDETVRINIPFNENNNCDGPGWIEYFLGKDASYVFNDILKYLILFVTTIYSKLYIISFLLLYVFGCIEYYNKITNESGNLKNSLIFINICIIFILSLLVIKHFQNYI